MHRICGIGRPLLVACLIAAFGCGLLLAKGNAWAQEEVKVGVLHSLTGTMAISETSLKDAVLMAVDEINAKGGVLGKKIKTVVVDPASNWDLFAEKAKELILKDKVAVVFGCWTSVSRKSVLPVFEANKGLLFYPVQYEGEEQSPNIFYTGATPESAIDSGSRVYDELGRRIEEEVLSPGNRLRLSADCKQDPQGVSARQRCSREEHNRGIYAVWPCGLSDHSRQDQEILGRR